MDHLHQFCDPPDHFKWITGMEEFNVPSDCDIHIDLDCDDSSGAINADFDAPDFDCHNEIVPVADEDIQLLYDTVISEMTVQLTGFVPDEPAEMLLMSSTVLGLDISLSKNGFLSLLPMAGAQRPVIL